MIDDYLLQEKDIVKKTKDAAVAGVAVGAAAGVGATLYNAYRNRKKYKNAYARCRGIKNIVKKLECRQTERNNVDRKTRAATT